LGTRETADQKTDRAWVRGKVEKAVDKKEKCESMGSSMQRFKTGLVGRGQVGSP